jgi:hypothetical protein
MMQRTSYLLSDSKLATKGEQRIILISTFIISLILSLAQVLADPVINSDGILYVQLASFIQQDDWDGAKGLYNWLFYPYSIALFSSISTLSLENSAYFLNACFTSLTCVVFVLIVRELGGKEKSILIFAALIILCYPKLNEYRNMVIRDHGYWAFYLSSCFFFFRSFNKPNFKVLLAFLFSAVLAILFRVEGIILLTLIPFIIYQTWLHSDRQKKKGITLFSIVVLILSVLTSWVLIDNTQFAGFTKISSQLISIQNKVLLIFSGEFTHVQHAKAFLNTLNPQAFSEDYAMAVLILTFFAILATEIISAMSPLYALVFALFLYKKSTFHIPKMATPWLMLISLNLAVLCAFLLPRFFLAGRYSVALALTLALTLPFITHSIFQKFNTKHLSELHRSAVKVTILLFIILSVDGLVSTGASKYYLKDAGRWIANSQTVQQATLFTNNQFVSYYSGSQNGKRIQEPDFDNVLNRIKTGDLNDFDLLAIQVNNKNTNSKQDLLNLLPHMPIKIFSNEKGDSVVIFKQ